MKRSMWLALFLILGGCASKPPELLYADGSERVPVNARRAAPAKAAAPAAPAAQQHPNHL